MDVGVNVRDKNALTPRVSHRQVSQVDNTGRRVFDGDGTPRRIVKLAADVDVGRSTIDMECRPGDATDVDAGQVKLSTAADERNTAPRGIDHRDVGQCGIGHAVGRDGISADSVKCESCDDRIVRQSDCVADDSPERRKVGSYRRGRQLNHADSLELDLVVGSLADEDLARL